MYSMPFPLSIYKGSQRSVSKSCFRVFPYLARTPCVGVIGVPICTAAGIVPLDQRINSLTYLIDQIT